MAIVMRTAIRARGGDCRSKPTERLRRNGFENAYGQDKVRSQIDRVVTIMKLCENMEEFRARYGTKRMKLRHAAALALVGWYLRSPTVFQN
jgi:hypothetical protein